MLPGGSCTTRMILHTLPGVGSVIRMHRSCTGRRLITAAVVSNIDFLDYLVPHLSEVDGFFERNISSNFHRAKIETCS